MTPLIVSPTLIAIFMLIMYGIGNYVRKNELIKSFFVKLAYSFFAPIILVCSYTLVIFILVSLGLGGGFEGDEGYQILGRAIITSTISLFVLIPYSYFTIRNKKTS